MEQQRPGSKEMEKELQEKLLAYRALEARVNSLAKQQSAFASKILEIQSTIESINEIKKGEKGGKGGKEAKAKDILFPLGSAAYTRGTVADKNKLIVEVGAGVALEKTADEAKEILEKRKKELEAAIDVLQKDMQSAASMMQKIEADAQEMVVKAQKEKEKFRVVSSE